MFYKFKFLVIASLLIINTANAGRSALGITHTLPSPYTLPSGVFTYGTSLAYGVTDSIQIGTNLHLLLNSIGNANAKIAIYSDEDLALATNFGWSKYNLDDLSGSKLATVNSYNLGLVFGWAITYKLAWTNGFEYALRKVDGIDSSVVSSGLTLGTRVTSELAWAYSDNNAVAIGATYDTTYSLWGFGISHYLKNFHLGVHYYPKAEQDKYIPIVAGSGSMQF
ncbi:MAG: hypothetical protein ISR65_05650 [Bacteriovoracaceae bacterium]|nr:hypothetical protein [Bacteriovoracaceae bacterium]